MKPINLGITARPIAMFVQIDPNLGTIVECALHYEVDVNGKVFRHEEWWSKISSTERQALQKLVDSAVKDMSK